LGLSIEEIDRLSEKEVSQFLVLLDEYNRIIHKEVK